MNTYKVIKERKAVYENPITLVAGQEVMVDGSKINSDPDRTGWLWCVSADNSGWVPQQILTIVAQTTERLLKASVNEDYSAQELTVVLNDEVIGSKILDGWLWGHKNEEEWGWVPLENLTQIL